MKAAQYRLFNEVPIGGRKSNDHYPTPRKAVAYLWRHLQGRRTPGGLLDTQPPAVVLDPACGEGNILDYFREVTGSATLGLELDGGRALVARSRGHLVKTLNALEHDWPKASLLVANPPYGKLAARFVHKAVAWREDNPHAHVAVLLYLSFLEPTQDRGGLFRTDPPDVLILPFRPRFRGEKHATNAQASAWYLWPGQGQIHWPTTLQGNR